MSYLRIGITGGRSVPEGYVELDEPQALALAQFCKRVTFSDIEGCAVDKDEAYLMRDALVALQRALGEVGYAPR